MNNGITNTLLEVRNMLTFVPDWAVAAMLLALAVIVAVWLHRAAVAILKRVLGGQHQILQRVITGTQAPSRLALILFALAVTVPAAPLGDELARILSQLLFMAAIAYSAGWRSPLSILRPICT